MPHNPRMNYGYPQRPPQDYFPEDPEDFATDYSGSDIVSEHQQVFNAMPARNLTELYSRNCTVTPVQVVGAKKEYSSQPYIQQYYYDRNPPQVPRSHSMLPPQNYPQPFNQQYQCCPINETNYAYTASHYNNMAEIHQYNDVQRKYQESASYNVVSKQPNLKRYPVTVRTPKYYRKPLINSIYKRPSALCLPVASQPDPAGYRRPKKALFNQALQGMQQDITPSIEVPAMEAPAMNAPKNQNDALLVPHQMDSEGDVNAKITNFEELLAKFERENLPQKTKSRHDIAKISKFLKPRVPSSIRTRHEKSKSKLNKKTTDDGVVQENSNSVTKGNSSISKDQLDVRVVNADSLEKLLNQLKKCELAVCKEQSTEKNDSQNGGVQQKKKLFNDIDGKSDDERHPRPPLTSSFNYRDISDQMMKSKCDLDDDGSTSSIQDVTKRLTSSLADNTPRKPRPFSQTFRKPPMDDHCALELHRSKSYIVNLIDRALSKELGTVPGERSRRKFDNMNPKKAIDAMNRHTGNSEKEFSMKITNALTDSLISNATAPEEEESEPSNSQNKMCCCNSEEPTYMKQLKQLRWGHLKHIQREVRRLEELEKFLDSCSITTIPEI